MEFGPYMCQERVIHIGMHCTCGRIGKDHSDIKRWTVHVGKEVRTKKKDRICGRTFLLRKDTHCAWNCVTLRCLSRPNDDDNLKCKLTLALCDPTLFDPTSHTVAFFNRYLRPIFATPLWADSVNKRLWEQACVRRQTLKKELLA